MAKQMRPMRPVSLFIPRSDLVAGAWYFGRSRHGSLARCIGPVTFMTVSRDTITGDWRGRSLLYGDGGPDTFLPLARLDDKLTRDSIRRL